MEGSPMPCMSFARGSEVVTSSPIVATESPIPHSEAVDRGLDMQPSGGSQSPFRRPDADFCITEELESSMDAQGVPNELVDDWAMKESKATRLLADEAPLPPHVRDMSLRFMSHFALLMNLPQTSWFQAAMLMDIVSARFPRGGVELLPATCVALVKILKKNDQATLSLKGSNLSVHAVQLGQWLQRSGVPVYDVTEEMLRNLEVTIMEALEWQINVPSIETWMSLFCTRFNVLTRGDWLPSLNWIWEQSVFYQRMVVMHKAPTARCRPQMQAAGLLGLSFVSARLLPLDMIRPEKLPAAAWEQLFLSSQVQCPSVPECVLQLGHSQRVLQRLQATTALSIPELKEACEMMALLLAGAVASMRQMQQEQGSAGVPAAVPSPTVHHSSV